MTPNLFSAQCKTLKIAVTTSASSSTALPSTGNTLRVVNDGPNTAFISVGTGVQTATVPPTSSPVATCTPVLAGSDISLAIPFNQDSTTPLNISAITAVGSASLYVSVGEGQ